MTSIQFLTNLHEVCSFQDHECKKVGKGSTSDLRRWIQNKDLLINGETVEINEKIALTL